MDESLTVGIVRPLSVSRRRSTLPSQMDVLLDSSAIRASGLIAPPLGPFKNTFLGPRLAYFFRVSSLKNFALNVEGR